MKERKLSQCEGQGRSFMEYPNYYYEQPSDSGQRPPKKRGVGGYIAVAVIFTLVGALLATILMPQAGMAPAAGTPNPNKPSVTPFWGGGLVPFETPAPGAQEEQPSVPVMTPDPATYTMPELDGSAPVIRDSVNPIPDIVDQVSAGVVGVINYGFLVKQGDYAEQGSGSGFVISTDGYILTNAHVVSGASRIGVMFVDGEESEAKLIGYDNTSDLAVLKVEKPGLSALKLGVSDDVRVGEFVITIGDPTGRELAGTTTFGIISATARSVNIDGQTNTYIQTDAAVNPGNSGGPLINMKGEVVGVTSAKTVTASYDEYGNAISAEGLGFALPINDAMLVVRQLITEGRILRPGIGVSVVEWDATYAKEYGTVAGVLVYSVTKNGPGDKAGLVANDIIVEANGKPMLLQEEFVQLVKAMAVGDELNLRVWRAGEFFNAVLTLADLNSLGSEYAGPTADYDFFHEND